MDTENETGIEREDTPDLVERIAALKDAVDSIMEKLAMLDDIMKAIGNIAIDGGSVVDDEDTGDGEPDDDVETVEVDGKQVDVSTPLEDLDFDFDD